MSILILRTFSGFLRGARETLLSINATLECTFSGPLQPNYITFFSFFFSFFHVIRWRQGQLAGSLLAALSTVPRRFFDPVCHVISVSPSLDSTVSLVVFSISQTRDNPLWSVFPFSFSDLPSYICTFAFSSLITIRRSSISRTLQIFWLPCLEK